MLQRIIAAHRHGGRRYTIFVVSQIAFALCTAMLGILTLLMQVIPEPYYPEAYAVAIGLLKVGGVLAPYLVLESMYWAFKRKAARQSR